jgi:hypothetical protein
MHHNRNTHKIPIKIECTDKFLQPKRQMMKVDIKINVKVIIFDYVKTLNYLTPRPAKCRDRDEAPS